MLFSSCLPFFYIYVLKELWDFLKEFRGLPHNSVGSSGKTGIGFKKLWFLSHNLTISCSLSHCSGRLLRIREFILIFNVAEKGSAQGGFGGKPYALILEEMFVTMTLSFWSSVRSMTWSCVLDWDERSPTVTLLKTYQTVSAHMWRRENLGE